MAVKKIKRPMGRSFAKKMKRNAPKILKAAGLVGLVASPVLAVIGTIPAVRAYDKRKEELGVEKLPVKEVIKTTWKYYVPTVAVTSISTAAAIKGDAIQDKRTALLAAAYGAAERTFAEYKDKVVEKLGEDKAKEVDKEVMVQQLEENKPLAVRAPYIQSTGYGDLLFYEPMTGTYFYSTVERVLSGVRDLSIQLMNERTADLNDLFFLWNLRETDAGGLIGWNVGRHSTVHVSLPGYADDPDFPNGVFMIKYDPEPYINYSNY